MTEVTPEQRQQRLAQTINAIIANPASWNQVHWHSNCGTSHCFAGHADLLAGNRPPDPSEYEDERDYCYALEDWHDNASIRAEKWLGLGRQEANYLFSAERNFGELYNFAQSEVMEPFLPGEYEPLPETTDD